MRLVGIDAPVEELVKLLGIAKQQAQQYNPDEHRDPKRRLLCVPSFRLPHQVPFPTDPDKTEKPEAEPECKPGDGHVLLPDRMRVRPDALS